MVGESFESYQNLLIELFELIKVNKDESEKGEEIRDRMDVLWGLMSERERVHVQQLTEFLYKEINNAKSS